MDNTVYINSYSYLDSRAKRTQLRIAEQLFKRKEETMGKNNGKDNNGGKGVEKNSEKDEIFFEAYKNKLLKPSEKEVKDNFPSRSAKLRYVTRNNNIFTDPIDFRNKFKKYLKVEKINV